MKIVNNQISKQKFIIEQSKILLPDCGKKKCCFKFALNQTKFTVICCRSFFFNFKDKPKGTQVTIPSGEVKKGERLDITCKARANPSPEYKFYHNGKLITHTSKGLYSLASVRTKDEGTYRCVPLNRLGVGPEASVTVTIATGKLQESFCGAYLFSLSETINSWMYKSDNVEISKIMRGFLLVGIFGISSVPMITSDHNGKNH